MTEKRIAVLQLIYGFGLDSYGGGAERFAFALSQALDPERFRVVVCGLWSLGTSSELVWMDTLRRMGVDALTLSEWDPQLESASFWSALRALTSLQHRERFDVLHSHSQFADIAVLVQGLLDRKLRIVRTAHDGSEVEWRRRPWRRRLLTRFLYPLRYDAEVGVSPGIVQRLDTRSWSRRLRRVAIHIPNAIDLARFKHVSVDVADKRRRLGVPLDAFVIGSVGRLTVEKGYDLLLEATQRVIGELDNAHVVLVGGGELAGDLAQRAADLGIAAHVSFTGPRTDVEEILPTFDLFVSSSRWEGLSTVILESMASGIPVISTAVGGAAELIEDAYSGWLVPPQDPVALADAITHAWRSRSEWKEIAAHASEIAQSYSIEAVVLQYEELYASLVSRAHAQSGWRQLL